MIKKGEAVIMANAAGIIANMVNKAQNMGVESNKPVNVGAMEAAIKAVPEFAFLTQALENLKNIISKPAAPAVAANTIVDCTHAIKFEDVMRAVSSIPKTLTRGRMPIFPPRPR